MAGRILVLTGGSPHAHDFDAIGDALSEVAAADGYVVERTDHPDAAAERLTDTGPPIDALLVDALFWRMLGDAYATWRDDWGYTAPTATRDALAGFVERGGGLVAMHTTPICFDDWPGWGDIVGGGWHWGVSAHPPAGPVRAEVVADHPVTAGVPAHLELVDEVYGDLDLRPGLVVLATARRHDDDAEQPVLWAHRYGAGRVVFDGFGHDAESIRDPGHRRVILNAIDWVLADGPDRAGAVQPPTVVEDDR